MPGPRLQQIIKTLLLVALGTFLYSRIANGTLYYYINERFAFFTLIGIGGLILLGLAYRWETSTPNATETTGAPGAEADEAHIQTEADHHTHDHSHALSYVGIAIIALPVLLGLAIPPQPLGAAALANRDVALSMSESALPVGLRTREKSSLDKNIMDWWHDFRSAAPGSATLGQRFAGQEVRVQGFVYRDARYGANQFMVTRFVVSCCVADANVLGLLVHTTEAEQWADDQWVEVTGYFANPSGTAVNTAEWTMPVVVAESISPIDVPNQPYLYP